MHRPALHLERIRIGATGNHFRFQWIAGGNRGGQHAGFGLYCVQNFLGDVGERIVAFIFRPVEIDFHGQHALRHETGIHFLHFHQAANQQARADQQHEGKRDLRNDQRAAHAIASQSGAGAGAAFFQSCRQIRPRE